MNIYVIFQVAEKNQKILDNFLHLNSSICTIISFNIKIITNIFQIIHDLTFQYLHFKPKQHDNAINMSFLSLDKLELSSRSQLDLD